MPHITEPGRYMAKVLNAEVGESRNTGTPFVSLYLEITGPAGDEGKHITAWLYLSEKAFKNTTKTLQDAFGFDGEFADLSAQIDGKECSITVDEEEDEKGQPRMKVAWVNPPRRSKPVEDGFLAKLTQKARELGLNPRTPAPKTPSVAPATEAEEEEIPF